MRIGIVRDADNVLEAVVDDLDGMNIDGRHIVEVPDGFSASHLSAEAWSGDAFVANGAGVEVYLIGRVNAERERRQMRVMTPGDAKKTVYAAKAAEVEAWNGLGETTAAMVEAFDLLAPESKARRFRYAMAEAAGTGDAVSVVIARFQSGADASQAEAARIEAIAQRAIRDVKAAATPAAKQVVAAGINWDG